MTNLILKPSTHNRECDCCMRIHGRGKKAFRRTLKRRERTEWKREVNA